jgi:proteasome beta subunit
VINLAENDNIQVKKTGTTTLGMVCKDGVVLAADKKSTYGNLIASKETDKIFSLDDHIAMTIAGLSGDCQALVRYMKAELKLFSIENKRKISVKGAATLLSNILHGSKFYPFYVQLVVAGFDDAGPAIFDLDPVGGAEEEKKFFSTGSGSPMVLGVLEDSYREGMSLDDGTKLALRAVKAAIERDTASGGRGIDIFVITKDGIKTSRYDLDKIAK